MTGHVNINFYNFKNVTAPFVVYDGISKMVLEETSKQIHRNSTSMGYILSALLGLKKPPTFKWLSRSSGR